MSDCENRPWVGFSWRSLRLLLLVLLSASIGCGEDSKFGNVHGVVRLEGAPVTKGTVRFVPDAGKGAVGTIQSDGTYILGTRGSKDGASIGKHRVAIIAYDTAEVDNGPRPADVTAVNPKVKPLVPQKYMSAGTSGLTFEVKPGDNEANFELKSGK